MSESGSRDLVGEAVDAVTLGQDVQWERCARLATPAERRALDKLRRFTRLFPAIDAAERGSVAAPAPFALASGFTRRAVLFLMALAAIEVGLTLALLPWHWPAYRQSHGDVAAFLTLLLAGHGASAVLLLWAGRHDRRTWLLGGYFLFKATVAPLHMLPAFWGHMPPADALQASVWEMPAPTRVFLLLYAYPLAFAVAPSFLWAFARECPRIHRRTRLDDLARRMVPVSAALGGALCAAVAVLYWAGTVSGAVDAGLYVAVLDVTIAAPNVLALAAVVVLALRARAAPADEVRRVVLFSAGFLLWTGLATAYDVVEAFAAGFWVSNYQAGSLPALLQPLRFPGMVLLWYSVLAARVPHPRELVRAGYRRVLARPGLLGAAVAAPLLVLGGLLASSPEREVGSFVADPFARSLLAVSGVMLLTLAGRERLLRRLDAWIDPETVDQRSVLAVAAVALAEASQTSDIRRTVARTIKRGCGSPSTLLVAGAESADARDFRGADATPAPLPRTSAIVHLLETDQEVLRVHPIDAASLFELLPPEEAAWVRATGADVIVPVPGPGANLLGMVVVGRRFDDRIVRASDVPFLETVAAAAGQAIARLQLLHGTETAPEAPAALACPVCGYLIGADEPPGCDCGKTYVETEAPRLLAGKYRLLRRLSGGGEAAVYLAWDLGLQRDVAVKTLTEAPERRRPALHGEARVMARVAHPALAEVHGVESWRHRPFLVLEYLRAGTLAERLRNGPLPEPEAAAVAVRLAEALEALHGAGYLHGDVKPSNIGFTASGLPKLLDFGLSRGAHDTELAGGTLRYLSPEMLDGRAAGEADDVWSLSVVLFEMVTGEPPFTGDGIEGVVNSVRNQRLSRDPRLAVGSQAALARRRPGSASSEPVAAFAASVLTAPRSARPATARAFATGLGGVLDTARFDRAGDA
ncbi:MAG: serine/threonine-protein kinase [Acidobacteria bacterium]|nr:serine/threonine-protein kinase [Acidobacteriota bacterium]